MSAGVGLFGFGALSWQALGNTYRLSLSGCGGGEEGSAGVRQQMETVSRNTRA